MDFEIAFFNEGIGPDAGHQFALADSSPAPSPGADKKWVPVSRRIALTVVAIAGLAQKVWMIWLLV